MAALIFRILESPKLVGVEPKLYLLVATHAALANRQTVTLPHDLRR